MAKSAIGPAWFSKAKFGRCDYDRFDDITSTPLLATKKMIGKVEVNCRFAFSKSVWGVIGENKNPAGIIYLDLNFQQPPGCRLQSATVTVILEKDSEENRCAGRSTATTPVQFTDHYGPKHLSGRETLIYTTRTKKITPEIQLLGQVGVGGVGLDKQTAVQTASRWKFTGHISTTAGHSTFNKLQWSLHENPYESQPTHGDEFHTAFALEHNAKRFYMTVKVKGKLLTISSKAKCLFKFGGKGHDAVTKVEWTGDYRHFVPLDDFAKGLPQSMENENLREVSVGVGDVLPATYHSVTGEPLSLAPPESLVQQASHSTPEYPQVSQVSGEPYDWPRTPRRGQIPHKTRHREPLKEMESVIRHLPAPTHENLGRASGLVLPPPIEIPARQPMDPASDSASGTTLVDTDLQDPFAATHNVVPSQKLNAVKAKLPYEKEEQRIARNMIQLWEWVGKMSILILGVMTGVFGFPLDQKLFGNMEGLVAKLKSDSKPKPWLEMEALSVRPTVRPTGLGESGDEEQIGLAAQGVDRRLRFAKDVCQSRVLEDY